MKLLTKYYFFDDRIDAKIKHLMIQIKKTDSTKDLILIEELASTIWTEHYTPIIGSKQVSYMLKKFQSVKTMQTQINEGYGYYLLTYNNEPTGYFSIIKKDTSLFLSKFYVLSNFRGKGIGSFGMEFIANEAQNLNCKNIQLTVNKFNTNSINAYYKMGFKNIKALVQDIGSGFIMDDYLLEKDIT